MNLQKLRQKIDQIDQRLVHLIGERTKIAHEIGQHKAAHHQAVYAPEREKDVYEKILETNQGKILSDSLEAIFREIMSAALSAEKELHVAYLGPAATFTHQASVQKFGSSVKYLSMNSISDIFLEVEKGRADYGVVPIENSTEGAVTHTLDMFIDSELKICSEVYLPIRHFLLSKTSQDKILRVYSKTEVFGQCRVWLKEHLPKADQIEVSSTSKAAEIASQEEGAASISSRLAASSYQLKILAEGIEDYTTNITRFLVIGQHVAKKTGRDKTAILFSVKDKVGALYEVLLPFKKHFINLTKIESRPSKKKAWEYYFFVDFMGHLGDPKVSKALKDLEKHCRFLKILGSYPFVTKN